jgi:hypothetical protein
MSEMRHIRRVKGYPRLDHIRNEGNWESPEKSAVGKYR